VNVLAFSGGKDSTALALELRDRGEDFVLLHTPTGDELPGVQEHIHRIAEEVKAKLIFPPAPTLDELITGYGALPNFHQRWCTRQIKIEPCIKWHIANPGAVHLVGLRADEEQRRGLYGDAVKYRYPLREWGWGLKEVMERTEDACIPRRTDCGLCFFQKLSEWQRLWLDHRDHFSWGEQLEEWTGHTFRTPGKDTWESSLRGLRGEFESGREPRDSARQLELFADQCRVCSM
jgi:hypothetical protein